MEALRAIQKGEVTEDVLNFVETNKKVVNEAKYLNPDIEPEKPVKHVAKPKKEVEIINNDYIDDPEREVDFMAEARKMLNEQKKKGIDKPYVNLDIELNKPINIVPADQIARLLGGKVDEARTLAKPKVVTEERDVLDAYRTPAKIDTSDLMDDDYITKKVLEVFSDEIIGTRRLDKIVTAIIKREMKPMVKEVLKEVLQEMKNR